MLFHSSIRRELSRSFGAVLVVLITVVMSMMLIRTLGLAARGSVNPRDVIMLMGYNVLGHLPTIMTLSLFIATTNTLSRLYRDSEMAVWFASGQGLWRFASPLFRFAWPVLLVIALLALFVWPWSAEQVQVLRQRYETRSDLDRVAAGQFQENASGTRVFFVERGPETSASTSSTNSTNTGTTATLNLPPELQNIDRNARNIFISARDPDRQVTTSAQKGRIDVLEDSQVLILSDGQRLDQFTETGELRISQFEEYGSVIGRKKLSSARARSPKATSSWDLLTSPSPANQAELSWRIGLALAAVNLLLVGLVASAVNPRAGRSLGITLALLIFVVYYNLLTYGVGRINAGLMTLGPWLLILHGGALLIAMTWIAARHNQWSWRNLLPSGNRAENRAQSSSEASAP
jgi:lipopolysaccharide export system permease protein